jgi:hypothetical protein
MHTLSGWYAPARENRDVSTVIVTDGACDIVRIELQRVGVGSAPGPKALDLLELSRPTPSFVKLAEGMGVAARRVHSAEELADARRGAFIEPGPHLIDAVVPSAPRQPSPGRPPARGGTPAGAEVGARPQKVRKHPHPPAVSTPTRVRVAGDRNPARMLVGRHRLAVHTAGRQPCAHPVRGHAGQTRPSLAAAATTRPSRPATVGAASNRRTG